MQLYAYILVLIFNTLAYFVSLFFIIKNRKHSVISVRSPVLLVLNNLGGFLMASIYICYEMIEDYSVDENNNIKISEDNFYLFCKIFPNNYVVCHFLMMISFLLRCHRIIESCKINYDERVEIKDFYDKRHLFKEIYYLKVLFAFMTVVLFINLLMNLQFSDMDLNLIPYHFRHCMVDQQRAQFYVTYSWIIINFFEGVVLITYTYLIFVNHIKQLIKFELCAFMIVWVIFPNFLRVSDFYLNADLDKDAHWTSWASCFFIWLSLLVNGYLPLIFSYFDRTSIPYHFNPKLANNIYLFLSNDFCYYSFYGYVEDKANDLFYLNLYTKILKYKLKYTIEPDYYKVLDDAKDIYETYFSSNTNNNYIDVETTNKLKSICQMLYKDECNYDMFDDALNVAYEHLEVIYKKFKRSEEYQILLDNLNLNSYIQCKMCNTGLVSGY